MVVMLEEETSVSPAISQVKLKMCRRVLMVTVSLETGPLFRA